MMIFFRADIHDPVTILRKYQERFMTGRKLDLTSSSEVLEGETLSIFVSRDRLLETAFDELLSEECNYRLPLDVTFYGEDAVDVGGPRKEFLQLSLQQIIEEENRLFEKASDGGYIITSCEDVYGKRLYYAAGLVCGMLTSVVDNLCNDSRVVHIL